MKANILILLLFISFCSYAQQKTFPDFLVTDTIVKLKENAIIISDTGKINLLRSIYNKEPFLSYYQAYGKELITKLDANYFIDLNQDNQVDYVYYGWAPPCNFQKYLIIAENRNSVYLVRHWREADFINFNINDTSTIFQLLTTGCCGHKYDYINSYCINKKDSIILVNKSDVFWQKSCEPRFPDTIIECNEEIIIIKDSVLLSLFPDVWSVKDLGKIGLSNKYYCKRGNQGIILYSEVNENQKEWYFIRIELNNETQLNERYLYGWICSDDIKLKD